MSSAITPRLSHEIAAAVADALLARAGTEVRTPQLIDKTRLAIELSLSESTIEKLTRDERIPSLKILGSRRYHVPDVLDALRGRDG